MTDYVYYRVETGPAFEFCVDLRNRRKAAGERLLAWATERGATGFVPGFGRSVIGGWAINSLIFDGEPDETIWQRGKRRTTDGQTQWKPRVRSKAGKALAAEMRDMEGMPSDDEFCERFGFPRSINYRGGDCRYGSAMLASCQITTARIGWTRKDVFWVVLPDVAAAIREYVEEGYTVDLEPWQPLPGMQPLTRAHYDLVQAQRKVADLEASTPTQTEGR